LADYLNAGAASAAPCGYGRNHGSAQGERILALCEPDAIGQNPTNCTFISFGKFPCFRLGNGAETLHLTRLAGNWTTAGTFLQTHGEGKSDTPVSIDGGNRVDWGKTSGDYAAWRPNYPDRFFDALKIYGVGTPNQHILDLGTGVGFLAVRFAGQGCRVTGVDISPEQIAEARRRAEFNGVTAAFLVAPAENTGLPDASFDVITASQAWLYFDKERTIREVKRLLKPNGLLVTTHCSWLPREDPIARASEALVLHHNPTWTGGDWSGEIALIPKWSVDHFRFHAMFVFDEAILFTGESWRGRMRACRGVGAALQRQQVEAFDHEHEALLRSIAGEQFAVLHRIDAHLLKPI
jgi:SAM-dependent methyltransferase